MPMVPGVLAPLIKAQLTAMPIAVAPIAQVSVQTKGDGTSSAEVAITPTPIFMDAMTANVIAQAVASTVIQHITSAAVVSLVDGTIK